MIISFASVKGGVGKTSSCANLSFYLAEKKKKKILTVDLDCQGGLTHHLSYKFEKKFKASIYDVLSKKCSWEKAVHEYTSKLHIIPVAYKLSELTQNGFYEKLKLFVDNVKEKYDFIFFDLSPAVYAGTSAPLALSDFAIVPVDCPGGLSLLGLQTAAEQILEIKTSRNSSLDILGILPSFVDRTRVSREVLDYLDKKCGQDVLPRIRKNAAISQAGILGKTIFEYRKTSNGAKDYSALGKEFIRRIKEKQEKEIENKDKAKGHKKTKGKKKKLK